MGKKKKPAPFRLTPAQKAEAKQQIDKLANAKLNEIRQEVTDQVAEMSSVAMAVAVFDIFGVKGWDLADVVRKYLAQFECIIAGTVGLDDLYGLLALEADLELRADPVIIDPETPVIVGKGAMQCVCWHNERGSIKYWAEKYGLKPQTVRGRLAKGWDVEKALTTPTKGAVRE